MTPVQENPSNSQRLESDFIILETIGQGGFGVVYKAKHKIDGGLYAVKEVTLHNTDQGRFSKSFCGLTFA